MPSAPLRAQTLPVLRLGTAGDDETTPVIWALDRGSFRKAGVDVQVQRAPSGAAVVAGVLGGSFDIGKSSLIALFSAHLRGLPITMIAPGSEYNADAPVVGTVVRNDSPWRTGADLNGKILAVSSIGDFLSVAVRTWMDAHGGDSSTLKLVEIPMSASPTAVETGRVDIAAVTGPFLKAALDTGKLRLFTHPPDAIAPHFLISAWFCTNDFATQRADDLRKYLRVVRDSAAYCNEHHAETVNVVSQFMGMEPAELARGIRSTLGVTLEVRKIQPLIDAAAKMKAISAPFDAREIIASAALR